LNRIARSYFFSNYFYGTCVLALSMETNIQLGLSLNPPLYYLLLFAGSVWYYTKSYNTEASFSQPNQRAYWYKTHQIQVAYSQTILFITSILVGSVLLFQNWEAIRTLNTMEWILLFLFPVTAFLYYESISPKNPTHNLRSIGWLKPFVISFVWTGVISLYPLIFLNMQTGSHFELNAMVSWFFLKNVIYISILCILFDIKDYAADHNSQLKTFVVRLGLRKTLFFIILPMAIAGFLSFLLFTVNHHFPLIRILINSIPFIMLIIVTWSMQRRKSILYYLAVIDGLLLIKAACGIIGVLVLK
jgi:4-hydroxybenzoate polyprenyltransferase